MTRVQKVFLVLRVFQTLIIHICNVGKCLIMVILWHYLLPQKILTLCGVKLLRAVIQIQKHLTSQVLKLLQSGCLLWPEKDLLLKSGHIWMCIRWQLIGCILCVTLRPTSLSRMQCLHLKMDSITTTSCTITILLTVWLILVISRLSLQIHVRP